MFDLDTSDLLLNFHGNYIPSKFVFTSDDRILYVGYAVDCLFKVNSEDFHYCTIIIIVTDCHNCFGCNYNQLL